MNHCNWLASQSFFTDVRRFIDAAHITLRRLLFLNKSSSVAHPGAFHFCTNDADDALRLVLVMGTVRRVGATRLGP